MLLSILVSVTLCGTATPVLSMCAWGMAAFTLFIGAQKQFPNVGKALLSESKMPHLGMNWVLASPQTPWTTRK